MAISRRDLLKGAAAAGAATVLAGGRRRASRWRPPRGGRHAVRPLALRRLPRVRQSEVQGGERALPYDRTADGQYDAPNDLNGTTKNIIKGSRSASEQTYVKQQCMHCVDPSCVSVCMMGALHKEPGQAAQEGRADGLDRHRPLGQGPLRRLPLLPDRLRVQRAQVRVDDALPKIVKCELCRHRGDQEKRGRSRSLTRPAARSARGTRSCSARGPAARRGEGGASPPSRERYDGQGLRRARRRRDPGALPRRRRAWSSPRSGPRAAGAVRRGALGQGLPRLVPARHHARRALRRPGVRHPPEPEEGRGGRARPGGQAMSAHEHPEADRREAARSRRCRAARALRPRRAGDAVPLRRRRRACVEHDRRLHLGHLGADERRRLHRHRRGRVLRRAPHLRAQQGPVPRPRPPAVLVGAIAYTLGGSSIVVALGRYWNAYWLPWIPYWNLSSALLEVAVCVHGVCDRALGRGRALGARGRGGEQAPRWAAIGRSGGRGSRRRCRSSSPSPSCSRPCTRARSAG